MTTALFPGSGLERLNANGVEIAFRRCGQGTPLLWGERGVVYRLFTPLADWQARTRRPVSGRTTPGGHYIPEESPELLADEMLAFFLRR